MRLRFCLFPFILLPLIAPAFGQANPAKEYIWEGSTLIASEERVIYADVPYSDGAYPYVQIMAEMGITGGCSSSTYCPDQVVTRAQMAIFLLKAKYGSAYAPPAATGTAFTDVPANHWAAAWIEKFAADGISAGCGSGIFCPDNSVTRLQMAVFLLKARWGAGHTPPSPTNYFFDDVPEGSTAAAWIYELANSGITAGCQPNLYCPDMVVTRRQMAVFIVKTFNF